MEPTDTPSSSKPEQEASKKSSEIGDDNGPDRKPEGRPSPQDSINWYKEDIRNLSASSLSLSIQLGKAKGAEARDLDLIRQLEADYARVQVTVSQDKEAIKKLEGEIEKQQQKEHNKTCWACRVRSAGPAE